MIYTNREEWIAAQIEKIYPQDKCPRCLKATELQAAEDHVDHFFAIVDRLMLVPVQEVK